MPHNQDVDRVYHIWEAATEAVGHARMRTRDDLESDRLLQHALVRLLEIIGEAASRVSTTFREEHPTIPWASMIGMRNRMAHAYFDINLSVVWRTVTDDLPPLIRMLAPILIHEGLLEES